MTIQDGVLPVRAEHEAFAADGLNPIEYVMSGHGKYG
jgi:hypothetical protein